MENWNEFMDKWDDFHRNKVLPYIKQADKKQRHDVNILLSDMKSSMKWCRFSNCIAIMKNIEQLLTPNQNQ